MKSNADEKEAHQKLVAFMKRTREEKLAKFVKDRMDVSARARRTSRVPRAFPLAPLQCSRSLALASHDGG